MWLTQAQTIEAQRQLASAVLLSGDAEITTTMSLLTGCRAPIAYAGQQIDIYFAPRTAIQILAKQPLVWAATDRGNKHAANYAPRRFVSSI